MPFTPLAQSMGSAAISAGESGSRAREIAAIEKELNQINSTLQSLQKQKTGARDRSLGRAAGAIAGPLGQLATSQAFREPNTPGPLERGGFLDKNVLSGQLPLAGGVIGGLVGATGTGVPTLGGGAPVGALIGAGLGGAAGQSIQNPLRQAIGLDPRSTIGQNLKSVGQAGLNMAAGEATGQVGGKLLNLGGQALKSLATSKSIQPKLEGMAARMATSSVPQSTTQIAKAVEEGQPTLGTQLAQRGKYGFKNTILEYAKQGKEKFGKLLGQELDSMASQGIDPNNAVKALDDIEMRYTRTGNLEAAKIIENRKAAWLDQILNKKEKMFVPTGEAVNQKILTPAQANILKREFSAEARSVFKKDNFDAVSGVNAEFAHAMAKGLRKEIENIVPRAKFLNKEFHFYDELTDAISTSIARDLQKGGLTIAQPLSTGAAAGAGLAIGGPAAAMAGGAAIQAARTFPVKTYLSAQLLKAAGKEITPEVASQISSQMMAHPTFRKAIIKSIISASTAKKLQDNNRK